MDQRDTQGTITTPMIGAARTGNDAITVVGKTLLLHRYLSDTDLENVLQLVAAKEYGKAQSIHGEVVPIKDVAEIRISENRPGVLIAFKRQEKTLRREYHVDSHADRVRLANYVAKVLGPTASSGFEEVAKWKAVVMPVLAMLFIIALGITSFAAVNSGAIDNADIRGARAGLKGIYLQFLTVLGPFGVVALTLIALAVTAVLIVQRLKRPGKDFVVRLF